MTASRGSAAVSSSRLVSMALACASSRSHSRKSVPHSRSVQTILRMVWTSLCAGARCSLTVSFESAARALALASSTMLLMAAQAPAASCAGPLFWAAIVASIRATASSTIRVSAFLFRRAYSSRNQRPRDVSMKASLIALYSASLGVVARAATGDSAYASSAMANSSRKSRRVKVTINMIRGESQLN